MLGKTDEEVDYKVLIFKKPLGDSMPVLAGDPELSAKWEAAANDAKKNQKNTKIMKIVSVRQSVCASRRLL